MVALKRNEKQCLIVVPLCLFCLSCFIWGPGGMGACKRKKKKNVFKSFLSVFVLFA